jgi:hypothetical protein
MSQQLLVTPEALSLAKMTKLRAHLVENSLYLGVPSIRESVTWTRSGRSDILVPTESLNEFETAMATRQKALDNKDPSPPPVPSPPEHALLSTVVLISENDYWLTSCGNWRGPTNACKTFADVKPSCVAEASKNSPFDVDFSAYIANLNYLFDLAVTPGFESKKGVIIPSAANTFKLKIRHVLFEVRSLSSLRLSTLPHTPFFYRSQTPISILLLTTSPQCSQLINGLPTIPKPNLPSMTSANLNLIMWSLFQLMEWMEI